MNSSGVTDSSNASHSHHGVLHDDQQVDIMANDLINSDLPTRQLHQIQTLIDDHENLQPTLQSMTGNDRLIQRINSQSEANIDTVIDSVDSMRRVGRICRSLEKETLSQETVEVINTEGQSLVTNIMNIYSRTAREIQQNSLILRQAIADNERTTNDQETTTLLQQQLDITTNLSTDPQQARRQIQEAIIIDNQLQGRLETLEPNVNATVRIVAQHNSRYLKFAAGIFFVCTAALTMCAGIAYLSPIVISAFSAASRAAACETVALAPIAVAVVVAESQLSSSK